MKSDERFSVVLGGGGFLGINLCRRLAAKGHRVRAFGHQSLFGLDVIDAEFHAGELADRTVLAEALRGADTVFHLIHSTVPYSANLDVMRDVQENLLPSIGFFDLARETGIKRVIFLSSGGTIYGRARQIPTQETAPAEPLGAYGISKLVIEKYLALYRQLHGLDYRVLRVANPFGPFQVASKRQGLIAEIILRAMRSEAVEVWGDGSIVRDFIYVDDVIDALELVAADDGDERIFNIGSGVGRSVLDVIAMVERLSGKKIEISWKQQREVDIPASVLSIERARDVLKWSPKTTFEDGVAQTIGWWKDNLAPVMQALATRYSCKMATNGAD